MRVGEHVRVVSLCYHPGQGAQYFSYQVMRLSSPRVCLAAGESGISSLTSLSPAEDCLAYPSIGDIVLDPFRRLCWLMRLGLVVALWSPGLLRANVPSGGHPS